MSNSLKIDLPGIDFTAMARDTIAAKLTESLTGADETIRRIVIAAMDTKVEGNGQPARYADQRNMSFVEWLAQDLIREATKQALKDRVEKLRPVLEGIIEKQLMKNAGSIATSLTNKFIEQATNGYGVIVNLSAEIRVKD